MSENTGNKSIILFDGVCNFCNSTVNRIIRNDKKDHFRFAALQSETGKKLLKKFKIDPGTTDSIILIENDRVYLRSGATLRISKQLGGLYPLLYGFIIIPPFLRNAVYDLIAKNRYKWFGKKESCMVPEENVRAKFIF